MDYKVAINQLTDAYIMHELLIRRESINHSTMRSRIERLLAILIREQRTQAKITYFAYLDAVSDLTECRKLFELAKTDLESDMNANAEKVEVQLIFLKERIFRVATNTEAIINTRSLLLIDIDTLQREFNNFSVSNVELPMPRHREDDAAQINNDACPVVEVERPDSHQVAFASRPVTSSPIRSNNNVRSPQPIGGCQNCSTNPPFVEEIIRNPYDDNEPPLINLGISPNRENNCPHSSCPINHTNYSNHFVPTVNRNSAQIWKWGIKYSSDDKSKSASEFIQRLQDLANSRNVPLNELLPSMPELLEGTAAQWFRTNSRSNPFQTFSDFVLRFFQDFEPYYKVDTRLELLKKRLQKPDETIVSFFAHVENEFLTMAFRPPEAEQVKIIRRNLLPQYINALALLSFNTVNELKEACKKLELGAELIKYQNINRVSNIANSGPMRYSSLQYSRPNNQINSVPENSNRNVMGNQIQPQQYNNNNRQNNNNNFNRNTSLPIYSVPTASPFAHQNNNNFSRNNFNNNNNQNPTQQQNTNNGYPRTNSFENNNGTIPNHNANLPNTSYNNFQQGVQGGNPNRSNYQPRFPSNTFPNHHYQAQQNNAVNSIEVSSPLVPSQTSNNTSSITPSVNSNAHASNLNSNLDNTVVEIINVLDDEITTQELIDTTTDAIAQLYSTADSENFNGVSYGEMNTPHSH